MAEKFRHLDAVTIPLFTTAERDALTPFLGLLIYNLSTDSIEVWNGDSWSPSVFQVEQLIVKTEAAIRGPISATAIFSITPATVTGSVFQTGATITPTFTGTQTNVSGMLLGTTYSGSASTVGLTRGLRSTAKGDNSGTTFTDLTAIEAICTPTAGTFTTITNLDIKASGASVAPTTWRGIHIQGPSVAATTWEAIKIEASSGSPTTPYGVRQVGASDLNIFAGKTRIGSTTDPTVELHVTGSAIITSSLQIPGSASGGADTVGELIVDTGSRTLNFHDGTEEVELNPEIALFSINVESPTSSEDIGIREIRVAFHITEIRAVLRGSSTPSVTWTIRHGTDRNATGAEVVTSGTTTTSTTSGDTVTSFNDATIVADSWIWLETTAESGTTDELTITAYGRYDV